MKKKSAHVRALGCGSFPRIDSLYGSSWRRKVLKKSNQWTRFVLTWKATNHTLLTMSLITKRFFTVRSDVTYTPTSRNATPTKRSS